MPSFLKSLIFSYNKVSGERQNRGGGGEDPKWIYITDQNAESDFEEWKKSGMYAK